MKTRTRLLAALKIWVVIYPSITLFLALWGDYLASLELYQRTFMLTITLVPWIVFVGVPVLDSILAVISTTKKEDKF